LFPDPQEGGAGEEEKGEGLDDTGEVSQLGPVNIHGEPVDEDFLSTLSSVLEDHDADLAGAAVLESEPQTVLTTVAPGLGVVSKAVPPSSGDHPPRRVLGNLTHKNVMQVEQQKFTSLLSEVENISPLEHISTSRAYNVFFAARPDAKKQRVG